MINEKFGLQVQKFRRDFKRIRTIFRSFVDDQKLTTTIIIQKLLNNRLGNLVLLCCAISLIIKC